MKVQGFEKGVRSWELGVRRLKNAQRSTLNAQCLLLFLVLTLNSQLPTPNRVFAASNAEVSGLIGSLSSKDKKIAEDSFEKLKVYGDKIFPEIYPELVKELKQLESEQESWFAERAYPDECYNSPPAERLIVEMGERAMQEMRTAALADDPYLRKTALYLFAKHAQLENIPVLLSLLSDSDWQIRHRAADLLGRYKNLSQEQIRQLVRHLQSEKEERVRLYLAQALCKFGNAVGARALMQNLLNKDAEIRALSARALRLSPPDFQPEAVKYLEKVLGNEKNKYAFAHMQGALNYLMAGESSKLKVESENR